MSGMSRWLNFHQPDLFGGVFKRIMYKAFLNRHCKLIVAKSFCLDLVSIAAAYERIETREMAIYKKVALPPVITLFMSINYANTRVLPLGPDSDGFDVRMRGSAAGSFTSGGFPR